jgi:hypothetical protein
MDINVEMPLDEDGYIDRSCPVCERFFRWHHGPVGELPEGAPEIDSYYCPYCGENSPPDQWWTDEQVEDIQQNAAAQIMPEIADQFRDLSRNVSKSGFLKVDVSIPNVGTPSPIYIDNSRSLIAVSSPCHPYEPLKIMSEWPDPVHCLVCGRLFQLPKI